MENSIEGILNQSWSCVPSEIFIRLHWERPLQRQSIEKQFSVLAKVYIARYRLIKVVTRSYQLSSLK